MLEFFQAIMGLNFFGIVFEQKNKIACVSWTKIVQGCDIFRERKLISSSATLKLEVKPYWSRSSFVIGKVEGNTD